MGADGDRSSDRTRLQGVVGQVSVAAGRLREALDAARVGHLSVHAHVRELVAARLARTFPGTAAPSAPRTENRGTGSAGWTSTRCAGRSRRGGRGGSAWRGRKRGRRFAGRKRPGWRSGFPAAAFAGSGAPLTAFEAEQPVWVCRVLRGERIGFVLPVRIGHGLDRPRPAVADLRAANAFGREERPVPREKVLAGHFVVLDDLAAFRVEAEEDPATVDEPGEFAALGTAVPDGATDRVAFAGITECCRQRHQLGRLEEGRHEGLRRWERSGRDGPARGRSASCAAGGGPDRPARRG